MKCVSLFLLLGRAGVWAEEHDLSFVLYYGEVVLRRWIPDGSLASKKSRGVGQALSSALKVALDVSGVAVAEPCGAKLPVPFSTLQQPASVPFFSTLLQHRLATPRFNNTLQHPTSAPAFSTGVQHRASARPFGTAVQHPASAPPFNAPLRQGPSASRFSTAKENGYNVRKLCSLPKHSASSRGVAADATSSSTPRPPAGARGPNDF